MGAMSYIAHLCEHEKRKELIEEVAGVAKAIGKTAEEVAQGFIDAHKKMKSQKNNPAFKELNKIHNKMKEEYNASRQK